MLKNVKKVIRTTILVICIVASILMFAGFMGMAMENADNGIGDTDFMLAVILTATSACWTIMGLEKLFGRRVTINFRKTES